MKITLSFRVPLCCANIAHTTAEEKPRTISTLIAYLFVCLNAWLLTLLLFKSTNQIVLLLCAIMIIMGQTLFFTISPASIFDETEKNQPKYGHRMTAEWQIQTKCDPFFVTKQKYCFQFVSQQIQSAICNASVCSFFSVLVFAFIISFRQPVAAFERITDYSFNHVVKFTCFTIVEYICRGHPNEGYLDVYVRWNDKTDDTNAKPN